MTQRQNASATTQVKIAAVVGTIALIFLAGWTVTTLTGSNPGPSPTSGFGLVSQSPGASGSLTPGSSSPGPSVPGESLVPGESPGTSPTAGTSPTPRATPAPTKKPGPTPAPRPTPAPTPKPVTAIKLAGAITGFSNAIFATGAHDGTNRIFVVQQSGQIKILHSGAAPTTFLDISAKVQYGGEQGLLGLAFDPHFSSNNRFYVYYTAPGPDSGGKEVVARYTATAHNSNVANPASEVLMVAPILHPTYQNHNGGMLAFGPDGLLYFGTGDGGSGGNPTGTAQNLHSLLGKILRINVNVALPTTPAIWAYGVRNPWRFSFDSATGDIWIGDVGQDKYEEIDHVSRAAVVSRTLVNFGWNHWEGRACYNPATGCSAAGVTMPVAVYAHGAGDSIGCAVMGGYVYRGPVVGLRGNYFFSDNCSGRIWRLAAKAGNQTPVQVLDTGLHPNAFAVDDAGNMYVVSGGGLYKIGL